MDRAVCHHFGHILFGGELGPYKPLYGAVLGAPAQAALAMLLGRGVRHPHKGGATWCHPEGRTWLISLS